MRGSVFQTEFVPYNGNEQQAVKDAEASLGADLDRAERGNFMALLSASIARVKADLSNSDCAKDFRNAAAAAAKASTIGFSDQGMLQYTQQNGVITPKRGTPGLARYNRFTGSINLNSQVDWSFPSRTFALLDGASWMEDLLADQAAAVGASSITGAQFMDLTILHELSHYRGAIGNPDTNSAVEGRLWNDCIK